MVKAQEIASAVNLILEGKIDEGMKVLDAFEIRNPQSPLLASVRQAREKLRGIAANQ